MIKTLCSIALLTIACLALIFTVSSTRLCAEPTVTPADSYAVSPLNIDDAEISCLDQSQPSVLMLAQGGGEHRCRRHCRRVYEDRMYECGRPDHPHHRRCERWAYEREQECLERCYREYHYY